MKFQLRKRSECCRRPSVIWPCRRKMFISGFKRYFGQTTRGFCITIMRRLTLHLFFVTISPKTQRISFYNHHICLIWLRVTSGYSPNSKDGSEDTVLTRLKKYKPNRRRLWRQFRKSNLTSVSTIGKNVGISALYREGITLKGMKLIWMNKDFSIYNKIHLSFFP